MSIVNNSRQSLGAAISVLESAGFKNISAADDPFVANTNRGLVKFRCLDSHRLKSFGKYHTITKSLDASRKEKLSEYDRVFETADINFCLQIWVDEKGIIICSHIIDATVLRSMWSVGSFDLIERNNRGKLFAFLDVADLHKKSSGTAFYYISDEHPSFAKINRAQMGML